MPRPVVIELIVQMVIHVGDQSTAEDINFYLNESSHCLGTEIETLYAEDHLNPGLCFTCHRASAKYLRDATNEDLCNLVAEAVNHQ